MKIHIDFVCFRSLISQTVISWISIFHTCSETEVLLFWYSHFSLTFVGISMILVLRVQPVWNLWAICLPQYVRNTCNIHSAPWYRKFC